MSGCVDAFQPGRRTELGERRSRVGQEFLDVGGTIVRQQRFSEFQLRNRHPEGSGQRSKGFDCRPKLRVGVGVAASSRKPTLPPEDVRVDCQLPAKRVVVTKEVDQLEHLGVLMQFERGAHCLDERSTKIDDGAAKSDLNVGFGNVQRLFVLSFSVHESGLCIVAERLQIRARSNRKFHAFIGDPMRRRKVTPPDVQPNCIRCKNAQFPVGS